MNTAASLVLFHSDHALVTRTIASIALCEPPIQALWVHINEANPAELDWLKALLSRHQVLNPTVTHSSRNDGFAQAHNRALESIFAGGNNYALVVNPDLLLAPDAIGRLMASDPDAARISGPLLELAAATSMVSEGTIDSAGIKWTATGRHLDVLQGERLVHSPPDPRRVDGISGACMFVGREAYQRLVQASGEFFDEAFIAYREDAELGFRACWLGIECWLVPAARGLHVRQLRGTTRGRDPFVDMLGVRNRFLLAFEYGHRRPGVLPLVLLRDAIVIAGVVLRERSSLPAMREAWQLRHAMRAKGERVRQAATDQK
jgi:GT2 family glycosyltransferase